MTRLTDIIKDLRAGVNIKKINLYNSGIGNEGVKLLMQALENNDTVTDINLIQNEITSGGARLIAYFLEKNRSVTHIDLRWNEIGNEGAKRILEIQAIRKNTKIDLNWNNADYTNEIDSTLLNNINTTLEKNIQAKKTLSKKSNQGIDSAQKKLPANDIGLKEKQEISKGMQQLKEAGQEKKSEQQEGINATLAKIINKQAMQDDILKLIIQKLDVVIGEVKLLTEQSSIQIGQTQLTENSSTGEHPELLLGVVAEQYYSPE